MRAAAVVLVLALLFAGCASPSSDDAQTPTDAQGLPFLDGPAPGDLLPMRFAADDYNATATYDESFTTPAPPCLPPVTACDAVERRVDVTGQVPAEAPVELAATAVSSACVELWLEVEDASLYRIGSESGGPLAASLVRMPAGTVTLVLRNCSLIDSETTVGDVPVVVEVRTVVRGGLVPAHVPVAVELAVGDTIEAQGDDLDTLIVVPPGAAARHLEDARFQVDEAMGPGTYVLDAIGGGDIRVLGPNGTLRALPIHFEAGDPRRVPSGQELSWDFTVPGVPLYVGLRVRSEPPPTPVNTNVLVLAGDRSLTVSQGDVVLGEWSEAGPLPGVPSMTVIGMTSAIMYTELLDERMTPAPFTVALTYSMAQGLEAYHLAYWVEP